MVVEMEDEWKFFEVLCENKSFETSVKILKYYQSSISQAASTFILTSVKEQLEEMFKSYCDVHTYIISGYIFIQTSSCQLYFSCCYNVEGFVIVLMVFSSSL